MRTNLRTTAIIVVPFIVVGCNCLDEGTQPKVDLPASYVHFEDSGVLVRLNEAAVEESDSGKEMTLWALEGTEGPSKGVGNTPSMTSTIGAPVRFCLFVHFVGSAADVVLAAHWLDNDEYTVYYASGVILENDEGNVSAHVRATVTFYESTDGTLAVRDRPQVEDSEFNFRVKLPPASENGSELVDRVRAEYGWVIDHVLSENDN